MLGLLLATAHERDSNSLHSIGGPPAAASRSLLLGAAPKAPAMAARKLDHAGRPTVQFSVPLRGRPDPTPKHQVGSLRDITKSIDLVPGHHVSGGRLRDLFL